MNKWDTEEAIRRWDMHAGNFTAKYTEEGDRSREVLLNPALQACMRPLGGKKVLDAGCGEGYLSRKMARAGALVEAVDYSTEMLRLAKERTPSALGITYHHGNLEKLEMFGDQSFDLIVSNMVIQDLAHYEQAIAEMQRLLVPGGRFIFSILHPCFQTPQSGWVKDDTGKKLYWKVDQYFNEGPLEQAIPYDQEEKFLYFHRTLSSYVQTIIEAGLLLEGMIEPKPSAEMLEKYPHFHEDLNVTNFLIFTTRRLG
ncbi:MULTISPECIES: class I SAM-dependent methyltransferase [Paenibacillus]|uniref:Methyltransferase n=2 Tax=Paenibacillus TaxID=44249 RepID=A0ABX2ZMH3_PAEPO|nr:MULTISPECIES: class I SAM-dependent methyltransferase [Paenibacillus]MDR6778362.1 2-polyprenyl-3-methyl-5-hydroxy-6-metoxy-1,4-benzoquinol methylase [Paenibacillus peoriae]ODA10095.1 methyltransferase [Paenibacillus polymyxa]OME73574.1 SAM-dependent methyltransferase [Paenibacillus peoriae]